MNVSSSKKQEQPEGFEFQIDDVFALKDGSAVVAGQVTKGVLRREERVVCAAQAGGSFLCFIEDIAQPVPGQRGQYLHPGEIRADGPGEGHCALRIPGKDKSYFRPGDRLVPVGAVPLDEPLVMIPKPCKVFLFHIKEIFSIQDVGTAVAGIVLNGSAGIGDTVSFGYVPGEAVFSCKIKAIDGKGSMEGGIGPVERATADGPCQYGCALIVDEMESRNFRVGKYLFIR